MSNEQKKCPNCGCTEVRVYQYDEALYIFNLATGEWDKRNCDERSDYLSEALCAECETDLLHLVPGQTLAEEPMVHKLRVALGYCVGFISGEHSTAEADRAEVLEYAREALGCMATIAEDSTAKHNEREQERMLVPLQCIPSDDYFDTYHVWPEDLPIPDFSSDDTRHPQELAIARFIERACNSHYKLLDALKWIVWEIVEGCEDKQAILKAAHTALRR